jgi:hypothetical protein
MLAVVSVLIRLLNYQRTERLLARLVSTTPASDATVTEAFAFAARLASLIRIAGRHLPANATCLRQSLLLWWILRRQGLAAQVCIGVSTGDGFAAHAWVEIDGQPVNDVADVAERFAVLQPVQR